MDNLRKYGKPPFCLAIVHGGPGASGEMASLACELAHRTGVLEPLQTAASVAGQREELANILAEHAMLPVILLGFSWGAWLSLLLTARYPAYVQKLLLVSSGGFNEEDGAQTEETRQSRLDSETKREIASLKAVLHNPALPESNKSLARLGKILARADAYDPLADDTPVDCRLDIFQSVWQEAMTMRRSGELLRQAQNIRCPVVAIHGDYDPHPAAGVKRLAAVVKDFRFILLPHCGHKPWLEREAKEKFLELVAQEL
jgi:pimeloyl-ACP methyl ester carboxylesterase